MPKPSTETAESANSINTNTHNQLNKKLIAAFDAEGRYSSFAEWATFAHFTLKTDVAVGRALANHLVKIIDTLKPAIPNAESDDILVA